MILSVRYLYTSAHGGQRQMNRWRWILALMIAIFAARAGFFPAERWWAIWGLVVVAGGIWLHRNELAREKRAQEAMEEDGSCWQFFLTMIGAFLAGTGWSLYHHLHWWSLLFGAGSFFVCFIAFLCGVAGQEQQE